MSAVTYEILRRERHLSLVRLRAGNEQTERIFEPDDFAIAKIRGWKEYGKVTPCAPAPAVVAKSTTSERSDSIKRAPLRAPAKPRKDRAYIALQPMSARHGQAPRVDGGKRSGKCIVYFTGGVIK
jgi:hypothetical protein